MLRIWNENNTTTSYDVQTFWQGIKSKVTAVSTALVLKYLPTPAVFLCVCLSVCLFVLTLKGKQLELSTPNLVHIYSIAVAWHALTLRSKGHISWSWVHMSI